MEKTETIALQLKSRNYGIDLLRLLSMLMVVTLHVLGQGGILSSITNFTVKGELLWAVEIVCYGAVNIYAIISGFVGNKPKHKYSNLISLCLQLTFYAIIITSIEVILLSIYGYDISIKQIALHLLPSVKRYWYFSSYFCLFFFMPILNEIVNKVSRKTLKIAGAFIFLVFICWTQISSEVACLNKGYSVLWLAILYVVGAYIAKYDPFEKWSAKKCFLAYLLFVLLTIASRIGIGLITAELLGSASWYNVFVEYTSPTIVLSSIFLVCGFSKLQIGIKLSKVISFLVPMSFGVYLIHCHPFVYAEMGGLFSWVAKQNAILAVIEAIGIALAIFIVCLFIDWLRLLLFKAVRARKISEWIEKTIAKLIKWALKPFKINFEE